MHRRNTLDVFLWGIDLEPGAVIVDVGAGLGTEVPTFSAIAGQGGLVLAIEAHPRTSTFLEANVATNHLHNVQVIQVAATDQPGTSWITDDSDAHIGNSLVTENGEIQVATDTIDALLRSRSIDHVDLLKMNIEGAEGAALRGARETLANTKHICVGCHDFKADRTGNDVLRTRDQVILLLENAGFRLRFRPTDPRPWIRDWVYGTR